MDAQGKRMHNIPEQLSQILQSISVASRKLKITPYMYGDMSRTVCSTGIISRYVVDIVLFCTSKWDVQEFYNLLSQNITINREVENSQEIYSIVSYPYLIKLVIKNDNSFLTSGLGGFTMDNNFIHLDDKDPKCDESPIIIEHSKHVSKWNSEDILSFAIKYGMYPESVIDELQLSQLRFISLNNLKHEFGVNHVDIVGDIISTERPGRALLFIQNTFPDGKEWILNNLITLMSRMNAPINEDVTIDRVLSNKKLELVDIYNEFFLFGKNIESSSEKKNRVLNTLRLLFDSPTLSISTPYIDRVSVITSPKTVEEAKSSTLVSVFATQTSSSTINSNRSDTYKQKVGNYWLSIINAHTNTTLTVGQNFQTYLRFELNIPANATINSARIQLKSKDSPSTGDANTLIYLIDNKNVPEFPIYIGEDTINLAEGVYMDNWHPSGAYGQSFYSGNLIAQRWNTDGTGIGTEDHKKVIFMRFNFATVPSNNYITSAILRMYQTSVNSCDSGNLPPFAPCGYGLQINALDYADVPDFSLTGGEGSALVNFGGGPPQYDVFSTGLFNPLNLGWSELDITFLANRWLELGGAGNHVGVLLGRLAETYLGDDLLYHHFSKSGPTTPYISLQWDSEFWPIASGYYIHWNIPQWTLGQIYTSDDIKMLVTNWLRLQNPSYTGGNYIGFIIDDESSTGVRTFESYEDSSPPVLLVEYTENIVPSGTGACCGDDSLGTCADGVTEEMCSFINGIWRGEGSICSNIDCTVNIPGDCDYPPCPQCIPSECGLSENGGEPCCCCSSIDIVSDTKTQCHKKVFASCNRDGSGPGPNSDGVEEEFGNCELCKELCSYMIGTDTSIDICHGEAWPPWILNSCSCDCTRYDPDGECSLTCLTCRGEGTNCPSIVTVRGEDCSYKVVLKPSSYCCGSPSIVNWMFVIDHSDSMLSKISEIKSEVIHLVEELSNTGAIARIAMTYFSHETLAPYVAIDWTTPSDFIARIDVKERWDRTIHPDPYFLACTGEHDYEAMFNALVDIDWDDAQANYLMLICDELPNGGSLDPDLLTPTCSSDSGGRRCGASNSECKSNVEKLLKFFNVTMYSVDTINGALNTPYTNDIERKSTAQSTPGGQSFPFDYGFSQIIDSINLAVFPTSCGCVDETEVPIIRDKGIEGDVHYYPECECNDPGNCLQDGPNALPEHCYTVPIAKCNAPLLSADCEGICDVPFALNVCGELVTITPVETNMVCCGTLKDPGFSCTCDTPTTTCPQYQCCAPDCDIPVCNTLSQPPAPNYASLLDAQNAIWEACKNVATLPNCGVDCLEFYTGDCSGGDNSTPITYQVNRGSLDNEVEAQWVGCGGIGGACCDGPNCTEMLDENSCQGTWMGIGSRCTPNPCGAPPPVEWDCKTIDCEIDDWCIAGGDNPGSIISDDGTCSNHTGCDSARNPSVVILNNGISLVAYETTENNNSVIKIRQFNTSISHKFMANREFGFARLQNNLRWTDIDSNTKKASIWIYDDTVPVDIIQGASDATPDDDATWRDVIAFQSGPLAGGCFPLYQSSSTSKPWIEPLGLGNDKPAIQIDFQVPSNFQLSSNFDSTDDFYITKYFIYDYQSKGHIIGDTTSDADNKYPDSEFLFGSLGGHEDVDNILSGTRITSHIHNGKQAPVANPKLAVAKNYSHDYENSSYVYLTYQALEDNRWNVYLKQIRLSEYSREHQISSSISESEIDSLSDLGISEVIYRVTCTNDSCDDAGSGNYLLQRTVVLEVLLPDGREVLNPAHSSGDWGSLCPGEYSELFPKKKVFVNLTHSVIADRCPDQFDVNEIFSNWEVGQTFEVPLSVNSGQSLFTILQISGDAPLGVGQFNPPVLVGNAYIKTSSVGAIWYDSTNDSNWSVIRSGYDGSPFETLSRFKGFDISEPILISTEEIGHSTHPVVKVNYDNRVFIVYEHTDYRVHNIRIKGTAYPISILPSGVQNAHNPDETLNYFLGSDDFVFSYDVTSDSDGLNQLPDMYIDLNDVIHLAWQSNRDGYWEIYYAQSFDTTQTDDNAPNISFVPVRITNHKGKSLRPSIHGNKSGTIYIVWHDDRNGSNEIYMAYNTSSRTIPLFQQDPYMASLRNFIDGWQHTTDVIPLVITNNTDDAVCYTNFNVHFYRDRLLENYEFEVRSDEFPFAFSLPGADVDVTTAIADDLNSEWTVTENYSTVGGNISLVSFVAVSQEIDSFLDDSAIQKIILPALNPSGGCQFGTISFRASNTKDDPNSSTQWTSQKDISGLEGQTVLFSSLNISEPVLGRYKQIELRWTCTTTSKTYSLDSGDSDADVADQTWENNRFDIRFGLDDTIPLSWNSADIGNGLWQGYNTFSLADVDGTLMIVYSDPSGNLKYAEYDPINIQWINNSTIRSIALGFDLAFDTIDFKSINNNPGVVYLYHHTDNQPHLARWSLNYSTNLTGLWQHVLIQTSSVIEDFGPPKLIENGSSLGIVYSVYNTSTLATSILYRTSSNGGLTWSSAETISSPSVNNTAPGDISIAIVNNQPVVTWPTTAGRVHSIRSGSWSASIAFNPGGVQRVAEFATIISYENTPFIFYSAGGGSSSIGWARYTGGNWTGNIVSNTGEHAPIGAVNINGTPVVAYVVGESSYTLNIARLEDISSNSWDIETAGSVSSIQIQPPPTSLAVFNTNYAAAMAWEESPTLFIEIGSVAPNNIFDSYLRFAIDIPANTTIITSHMDITPTNTDSDSVGDADVNIKLLDYYNTEVFEDNYNLDIPINSSDNDSQLTNDDICTTTGNTIRFGLSTSVYDAYLRFQLAVPEGSHILSATMKFKASSTNNLSTNALIRLIDASIPFASTYTYTSQVSVQSDDADWNTTTGGWYNSNEVIRMGNDGLHTYDSYLRFAITSIPKDAVINESYITVDPVYTVAGESDILIKLLESSNTPSFVDTTINQYTIADDEDDAYRDSVNYGWENSENSIKIGKDGASQYSAYLRFKVDLDPELILVSSRLKLYPAYDYTGNVYTRISLLSEDNSAAFPDTYNVEIPINVSVPPTGYDSDADRTGLRWSNDNEYIRFGQESVTDGLDVFKAYLRFQFDSETQDINGINMKSFGQGGRVVTAKLKLTPSADTLDTYAQIKLLDYSNCYAFPTTWNAETTINESSPSAGNLTPTNDSRGRSDAWVSNDTAWNVTNSLRVGDDGTNVYDTYLRFDISSRIGNGPSGLIQDTVFGTSPKIIEAYLTLVSRDIRSMDARVQLIDDGNTLNNAPFSASTSATFYVDPYNNRYDWDGCWKNDEQWFNGEFSGDDEIFFGADGVDIFEAYLRFQLLIPKNSIVSQALLYVTATDNSNTTDALVTYVYADVASDVYNISDYYGFPNYRIYNSQTEHSSPHQYTESSNLYSYTGSLSGDLSSYWDEGFDGGKFGNFKGWESHEVTGASLRNDGNGIHTADMIRLTGGDHGVAVAWVDNQSTADFPKYRLHYSVYDGITWDDQLVGGDPTVNATDVYGNVNIVVVNNNPHIAYTRESGGVDILEFATSTTGTFSFQTIETGGIGLTISEVHMITSVNYNNNEPIVAYIHDSNVYYSEYDGSNWSAPFNITGDIGATAPTTNCLRIAIIQNRPAIAYSVLGVSINFIRNHKGSAILSGNWFEEGLVTIPGNVVDGRHFDMAEHPGTLESDVAGQPFIIYFDSAGSDLCWATSETRGATWTFYGDDIIETDGVNYQLGYDRLMFIDDIPYVAYRKKTGVTPNRYSLMLASDLNPSEGTWNIEAITDEFPDGTPLGDTFDFATKPIISADNLPAVMLLSPPRAPVIYYELDAIVDSYIRFNMVEEPFNGPYYNYLGSGQYSNVISANLSLYPLHANTESNPTKIKHLDDLLYTFWFMEDLLAGESTNPDFTPEDLNPTIDSPYINYIPAVWVVGIPETIDITEIVEHWVQNTSPGSGYMGIKIEDSGSEDSSREYNNTTNPPVLSVTHSPPNVYNDVSPSLIAPVEWTTGNWVSGNSYSINVTSLVNHYINNNPSGSYDYGWHIGFSIKDASSSIDAKKSFADKTHATLTEARLSVTYSSGSSPTLTSSYIDWDISSSGVGNVHVSPNISTLIQEYIDNTSYHTSVNTGWHPHIGLSIQDVAGVSVKSFDSWNDSAANSAILTLVWSPEGPINEWDIMGLPGGYNITSPLQPVGWNTGEWNTGVPVWSPEITDIVRAFHQHSFSFNNHIGFVIEGTNDYKEFASQEHPSLDSAILAIDYTTESARSITDEISGILWNPTTTPPLGDWDGGGSVDRVVVESPDIISLIKKFMQNDPASSPFLYNYYGSTWDGTSYVEHYYADENHTSTNASFVGQYIGLVIEELGTSNEVREFISFDDPGNQQAILEIDSTTEGARSRYSDSMDDASDGVEWTASDWDSSPASENILSTPDISVLVESYISWDGYSPSSTSYMGIVFESQSDSNPLKQFYSWDAAYLTGAELVINWSRSGAISSIPGSVPVEWTEVENWSSGTVNLSSPEIKTLVQFRLDTEYSYGSYIGFAIDDDGSSGFREFYSFDSGDTTARLLIDYTGGSRTTANLSVPWNSSSDPQLGSWTILTPVSTPELNSLVQYYIDKQDRSIGQYIGFKIEDNASSVLKRFHSFESSVDDSAHLHVTWRNNYEWSFRLDSLAGARLCLGSGQSAGGSLDLTPVVRIDANGNEVTEFPLPIDYHPNWTYFTALTAVTEDGNEIKIDQKTSVSCLSCRRHPSDTTWDYETCSIEIDIENTSTDVWSMNVAIRFYADLERNDIVGQLSTFEWGDITPFTTKNGDPASSVIENGFFIVAPGSKLQLLAWPTLSPNSGLLCGIKYHYDIVYNNNSGSIPDNLNTSGKWVCDCKSVRWSSFETAPENIYDLDRWVSSGFGLSDTRLTETSENNYNPTIRIRDDYAGVVLYHTTREKDSKERIYASVFSNVPSFMMYASSTEFINSNWDTVIRSDIPISGFKGTNDVNTIIGNKPVLEFDQYSNMFMAANSPYSTVGCQEFGVNKAQSIVIHRCGLSEITFDVPTQVSTGGTCTADYITERSYTSTSPEFNSIINMIRIRDEFVRYHVTRDRVQSPVVDQCHVEFEIIGSPSSVAIRLRNGLNSVWSDWNPFNPDVGENTIYVSWDLERGRGNKIVQFQVATSVGITPTSSMTIIADYKHVDFEVKFYKSIEGVSPPNTPSETDLDNDSIFSSNNILSTMDSIPVASLRPPGVVQDESGGNTIVLREKDYIFIEIIPSKEYLSQFSAEDIPCLNPTFDFIQQGGRDEYNLHSYYNQRSGTYRSYIEINKEDMVYFKDGLSYIIPHFAGDCSDYASIDVSCTGETVKTFTLDEFNKIVPIAELITNSEWDISRNSIGEITDPVIIRNSEDPYFIFGNPNYRLGKNNE